MSFSAKASIAAVAISMALAVGLLFDHLQVTSASHRETCAERLNLPAPGTLVLVNLGAREGVVLRYILSPRRDCRPYWTVIRVIDERGNYSIVRLERFEYEVLR